MRKNLKRVRSLRESEIQLAVVLHELHKKFIPHDGQVPVGRALFYENIKNIFLQCGRKYGKTDTILYCLWRWANTNPGSENYYFAPFQKQAKEIVWASGRAQNFGPNKWFSGRPNNTEMRLTFKNGSFIKFDGSDNFEAYRGITPKGLMGYDEFKDFRPEFHKAFNPNRAAYDCPLIIAGTPPDRHCQYIDLAEDHKKDPDSLFIHAPTWVNPYIPRSWLEKEKAKLYRRGDGDEWEREYEALYVKGGASKIFPMLKDSIIRPHDEIVKELHRDRRKLKWILWTDPAAASCFGALFVAVNPYTKKVYILDEIYEKNQAQMSVRVIGRVLLGKRDELFDGEWDQGYDEAETWFMNEMLDRFGENFHPSAKAVHSKVVGLSLIKDILLENLMVISDRCKNFYFEMDNYFKDKKGDIPKENDHLIDCLRYLLHYLGYMLEEEEEYTESKDEMWRGEPLRVPQNSWE